MKKSNAFLALLFISFGFQNVIGQENNPPQKFNENPNLKELGVSTAKIKTIDSLLQSFVKDKKTNCVTAFVAKGGNVIYKKAFGLKDIENNIPATTED